MTTEAGRTFRRGIVAAALVAALVLLGLACGTEDDDLSNATGSRLASRSDLVASRLKAGNSCGAKRAAVALYADAQRAIKAGEIGGQTASELTARTNSLVSSISCVTPPPEPQTANAPPDRGKGDEGEQDEDDEDHHEGDD